MYLVARNTSNNTFNRRSLRILVHDVCGPEGHPWTDLLGNALELVWNISHDGRVLCRGKVNEQGWIVVKICVPPDADDFVLRVGPARPEHTGPDAQTNESLSDVEADFEWCEQYQLEFEDKLPPITEVKGVQARLNQLAYHAGRVDGNHGPVTTAALIHFQEENGLDVTGNIDDQTRAKLDEEMRQLEAED